MTGRLPFDSLWDECEEAFSFDADEQLGLNSSHSPLETPIEAWVMAGIYATAFVRGLREWSLLVG